MSSWRKTKLPKLRPHQDLKMRRETSKTKSDSLVLQNKFSESSLPRRMIMVSCQWPTMSSSKLFAHTITINQKIPASIWDQIKTRLIKFWQSLMSIKMAWSHSLNSSSLFWLCKLHPRLSNLISRNVVERWIFNRCPAIWELIEKRLNSVKSSTCLRDKKRTSLTPTNRCASEFSMAEKKLLAKNTLTSETHSKNCSGITSSISSMRLKRDQFHAMTSLKVFMFIISHSTSWTTTSTIFHNISNTRKQIALLNNIVLSSTCSSREPKSLTWLWPKVKSISKD